MQTIIKNRSGFTFVEFSIAMLFLALLSLTVALVVSNISSIYRKGLTIKSINSTGSDLIEDFSTMISSSPASELESICAANFEYSSLTESAYQKCLKDYAYLFIYNNRTATSIYNTETDENMGELQISGTFCTGKYSYIWHTGYVDNVLYVKEGSSDKISAPSIKYRLNGSDSVQEISQYRLLRIEDPSRVACASQLVGYGDNNIQNNSYATENTGTVYDLTKDSTGNNYFLATTPVELINETENSLSLYNLYVAPPSQDSVTSRIFYSGSFVLATLLGGVDITKTGEYCEIDGPSDDFEYCAINKFNFAAQATGK